MLGSRKAFAVTITAILLTLAATIYFLDRDSLPASQSTVNLKDSEPAPHQEVRSATTDNHNVTKALTSLGIPFDELNIVPRSRPRIDRSKYNDKSYVELRDLALAGDADAAVVLSVWLESCKTAPPIETASELEKEIEHTKSHYLVRTYDDKGNKRYVPLRDPSAEQIAAAVAAARQMFDRCNDLSTVQRQEAAAWLSMGVEAGSIEGHIGYALMQEPTEALPLLEKQWQLGDPAALSALAQLHQTQYGNGNWPDSGPKAIAARALFHSIMTTFIEGADNTASEEKIQKLKQSLTMRLEREMGSLHGYQKTAVRDEMQRLIGSVSDCCYGGVPSVMRLQEQQDTGY